MSQTVTLLIGHGSRHPAGNAEFFAFAERLQQRHSHPVVPCFLSFHQVSVADGINQAVALGARRIIATPVILLAAGHVKRDIPQKLAEARLRHPQVAIDYAECIGICDQTISLLTERVAETCPNPQPNTAVLVLGRGSSDPDANANLTRIAQLFKKKSGYDRVRHGFIAVSPPNLPTAVAQLVERGAGQVIIAPYLLFAGVLMERIHETVDDCRKDFPHTTFAIAQHLGLHDLLLDVVTERIEAARGDRGS